MNGAHTLWYNKPAQNWNEALPLGNGRIGAMVYGGVAHETLALNEDTLWSGYPHKLSPRLASVWREAKALANEERFFEAKELLETQFGDRLVDMYLPLGTLEIETETNGPAEDYARTLSLRTAVHTTRYTANGRKYERECFISAPRQVLVLRIACDRQASVSIALSLRGALVCQSGHVEDEMVLTGHCPTCELPFGSAKRSPEGQMYNKDDARKGVGYLALARVERKGGRASWAGDTLHIDNSDEVTLYLGVRTSFSGAFRHPVLEGKPFENECRADVRSAAEIGFEALKREHIVDHQALYDRAWIDLGETSNASLPTDERLLRHEKGESDPSLYALLFHYGRYLTITASRPGTQPMNLQGIWNNQLIPPWSSNYTLNINTEMNYWPTLAANLTECYEPLIQLAEDLKRAGEETARDCYGAQGFCAHHATDLWRITHPNTNRISGNCQWGQWPLSGGWLCEMLYAYYDYTRDLDYLKRVLPVLRAGADFFLSMLTEKDGELVFLPATSPENNYLRNGKPCPLDTTSAMACAIAKDCLNRAADALTALGEDCEIYRAAASRVRGHKIAPDGTICEWYTPHEDAEAHHRHLSQLYGLFPSHQLKANDLETNLACRKTLEKRGDNGTGWSLAWKINLWARLGDGERAKRFLDMQLRPVASDEAGRERGGSFPNLLCAHPPFQIDGNFGAASGILNMLLQMGQDGVPVYLPALPLEWSTGQAHGILIPGNECVSFAWENGRVIRVSRCATEKNYR